MNDIDRAYAFMMRAHLTEEALDASGRVSTFNFQ